MADRRVGVAPGPNASQLILVGLVPIALMGFAIAGACIGHLASTMDKSLKDDYIRAYLHRQKAHVHSYSSQGLELRHLSTTFNETPARTPSKKLNFGFDTPILVPRVTELIDSTDKCSVVELPAKATQRTRKTQKALDNETSGKKNKGTARASPGTTQRDPSKRKRKKAEVLSGSDEEREARLSERRERKRVKRDIVKPDANIAVHSSPASGKKYKKAVRKKGKKHSGIGFALLHGFSATNVGKNRLTLKPLASLGVFNKGKSSTKTKVHNAKQPVQKLFSESAFLEKTTKQHESLVDEAIMPDSSSQPPSPSPRKIKITNYRKDKNSTRSTSRHSAVPDLPRGSPAVSETWDIELQSQCPSSDGFRPRSDIHTAGSLVLDPRMASWHDQEMLSKGQAKCSSLIITPVKEMSHDSPTSAIATIYDLDGDLSIHPSHSASQVGLKRLDRLNSPVEPLTSKYFAVHANHDTERVSPTFDQPHSVDCNLRNVYPLSVTHPHDSSTMRRAAPLNAIVDSSPLHVHGIPEQHSLPLADDIIPTYQGYSAAQSSWSNEDVISAWYATHECTTVLSEGDSNYYSLQDHDLVILEPPHLVDEPSYYLPVQDYSSDGLHDISVDDMVVLDEAFEAPEQLIEYTEVDDYEYSDVVLGQSSLCYGSFSSPSRSHATAGAYDNTFCSLRPFLQGRAMLLGIPPYVPPAQDFEQTKIGSGLLSAEVDVAKHLKDHWRPHRL
ncbi:uncharacterized protein EDB91DRAFT_1333269 [Suillus paluster]|uniref:uncharacterized protein n=1 Tax=Suillus paluster TaxID=48578 RepID=UPI001B8699BC|nr:uncharacterized protein EDB91DRAFT_1333269 [Suillus paluster]KAG1753959.1 hypothetical protein EDB91DRAFT_1333269 [Suillus paluster]